MANDRVHELAAAILDAVVDFFAAQVPPIELPARQYVSNGPIAFDCAQVVVEVVRLFPGGPGAEIRPNSEACVTPRGMEVRVWVLRDVPSSEPGKPIPSAAAVGDSGLLVLTDLWVLVRALTDIGKSETLTRSTLVMGSATPIEPQGAVGGSVATIQVLV